MIGAVPPVATKVRNGARRRPGMSKHEILERDRKALELREQGLDYEAIGAAMGVDASTAFRGVERSLLRRQAEPAQHVAELEVARLDKLLASIWERALGGDYDAIDRVLKLSERRCRMLGLDFRDGLYEREVRVAEAYGQMIGDLLRLALADTVGELVDQVRALGAGDEVLAVLADAEQVGSRMMHSRLSAIAATSQVA